LKKKDFFWFQANAKISTYSHAKKMYWLHLYPRLRSALPLDIYHILLYVACECSLFLPNIYKKWISHSLIILLIEIGFLFSYRKILPSIPKICIIRWKKKDLFVSSFISSMSETWNTIYSCVVMNYFSIDSVYHNNLLF
jgi:hypothetical protein